MRSVTAPDESRAAHDADGSQTPTSGPALAVKRAMDIAAALGLIAFISPLLAIIAIAVRVDSPGPSLFQQTRNGRHNKPFTIYKFRTMYVDDESDAVTQAVPGDARVTRVGRFLRRSSLDELPQLFNVVLGDMSIIGPRPHVVSQNEYYKKLIDEYDRRTDMRPGLTGLAQIHGLRGPTPTVELMAARVKKDIEYIRSWSIWTDLGILAKTCMVVVTGRNAI